MSSATPPRGVADEDSLLESESMHQLHGKLCLLRRIVRVVAMPVGLQGALGQPKTRAVIGNDCPGAVRERRSDAVPCECAGPEPVQEQEERFALPIDLVMKPNTAHGDKLAVLVGELVGRLALVGAHPGRETARTSAGRAGRKAQRNAREASHCGWVATCARKSAVAWTTRRHCSAAAMVAAWSPICVPYEPNCA